MLWYLIMIVTCKAWLMLMKSFKRLRKINLCTYLCSRMNPRGHVFSQLFDVNLVLHAFHCVKYRNFTKFFGAEILWKDTVSAKLRSNPTKFSGNYAFSQNFHTKKLGEITVIYAVFVACWRTCKELISMIWFLGNCYESYEIFVILR